MKNVLFSMLLALALSVNASAQLVVDSLGKVGIGTENPTSTLSVKGAAGAVNVVNFEQENQTCGLSITSVPRLTSNLTLPELSKSVNIEARVPQDKRHIGINSFVRSVSVANSALSSIGIMGESLGSRTSIGIYGKSSVWGDSTSLAAGVYGAVGNHSAGISGSGRYAGYFSGPVKVTGKIYGTICSPASSAKTSYASLMQATPLAESMEESVSDKLLSIQTIQFVREEEKEERSSSAHTRNAKSLVTAGVLTEASEEEIVNEESSHETEMVRHYGVDAEQLEAAFPELVTKDQQGDYCVNYSEMVPLLLQSIRELSARVEELEGEKGVVMQKAKAKATSMEADGNGTDVVRMSQNNPNPFGESSVITLCIPENAKSAAIYIYDLSGKQVKSIAVSERGETNVTVYATDLSAGMFVYSLVVDGNVAVTRRMMVVKN